MSGGDPSTQGRSGGRRKHRVRHHVNPLSFRREVEIPDWAEVFADAARPLEVDVGFAHGTFLLEQAARTPEHNFVGLEIRVPMVEEVKQRIAQRELTNVCAVLCNANQSFRDLFQPASLHRVYVHFPDPWFKARHHKRRRVKPAFLDDLAVCLEPGGELRFMTDYAAYAEEVVELVEAHPAFENSHGPGQPAPFEAGRVMSLREEWHLSQEDPVHRYHWRRKAEASGQPEGATP